LESQEVSLVKDPAYKSYTDPELISLCLEGDGSAWETLIQRYRRLIHSIPVQFGFSSADIADVFQSICVKLLEHLHEIKAEKKIAGWLITTTTRYCLRVRVLRARESLSETGNFEESPEDVSNIEELRLQIEQQQAIRDAVGELTGRCTDLISLLYLEAEPPSYQEIGQRLNMPVASIGPTRARCLEKLRTILMRRGINQMQ
jgi:RNA polymerase sigma factor (sigma-70 family)